MVRHDGYVVDHYYHLELKLNPNRLDQLKQNLDFFPDPALHVSYVRFDVMQIDILIGKLNDAY